MKNVIQLLPDDLASQVAAGEVVERPASVVKELVENSIDAGATHIEVSIQRGGLGLIRVQDNGCGMSPVDAETSLLRHATSKLRTSDDLSQILTMGFRGEAVPSIASVSQFRLVTKTRDAIEATEIAVQGGSEPIIKSASNTVGTIVEAKELFFNIPARRKFLKSERTEAAHVEHQIRVHALAKPEIRWLFRRDNKLVFDIPASKDIRARLSAIHGKDVASQLTRIDHYELHDCEVHGYMASLDFVRKSRKNQFFFINGRPVEDTVLTRSVREVFIDKLQEGEHPMVWLWITMPPDLVDVNVHPAKREIRLLRPLEVRNLIAQSIARAFSSPSEIKSVTTPASRSLFTSTNNAATSSFEPQLKTQDTSSVDTPNYTRPALQINSQFFRPKPTQENLLLSNASSNDPPNGSTPTTPEFITEAGSSSSKARPISNLKLLTTLKDQYFLIESPEGLVILDPKRAWERVVYDMTLGTLSRPDGQVLLVPIMIELDPRELDFLLSNQNVIEASGIFFELFGSNAINITEVPQFFEKENLRSLLNQILDDLQQHAPSKSAKTLTQDIIAKSIAKKTAMTKKASSESFDTLLKQLFSCKLPYCAPNGQPTMFQTSLNELKNRFK